MWELSRIVEEQWPCFFEMTSNDPNEHCVTATRTHNDHVHQISWLADHPTGNMCFFLGFVVVHFRDLRIVFSLSNSFDIAFHLAILLICHVHLYQTSHRPTLTPGREST